MKQNKSGMERMSVFAGNSNLILAKAISRYLGKSLGKLKATSFSDGEIQIELLEDVRKKEVFVIQSTCDPVNHNIMELLLLIDAFKRSSAKRINAVIPYFGYARQDKKVLPRVPISAKLIADLLYAAGIHRVITLDLHAGQIQGFFNCPVDNLFAAPVMIKDIKNKSYKNMIVVSPDAGGVERARAYAKRLKAGLAIVDKRRSEPNKAKAMNIIGNVRNKIAIILDDMVDTAGTLVESANVIMEKGAKQVHAYCTHPVLSGSALSRISKSALSSLVVTDTILLSEQALKCSKIKQLSIANLVGEAISRSYKGKPVNSLFIK